MNENETLCQCGETKVKEEYVCDICQRYEDEANEYNEWGV